MRKYTLTILLCAGIFSVMGQDINDPTNYIRTDLISPSPTAEDMTRYGDIPVTLYSGKTNVSIPIHECKGINLSLPITLNYNYSGFKPQQEAGWVGLGWTLSTGGVITRTIKDKVDNTMYTGRNYSDIRGDIISMALNDQDFLKNTVDAAGWNYMYDTEPDVYSFNFAGHSGRFIIMGTQFHVFPRNRFKISGDPGYGFVITTDDGIDYHFDVIETTQQRGVAGANYNIPDFNSAFHLSKVIHPTGEMIKLEYANEGTVQQAGIRSQTFKKGIGSAPSELKGAKIAYPTNVQNTRRLSYIYTSTCSVYFKPGAIRSDVNGNVNGNQKSLDAIEIMDHNGNLYKKFEFNTSYFGSTASHHTCYLKLNSVVERGADGSILSPHGYEFDYENESSSFPNSVSAAIDHYGYLNASYARADLIPKTFWGKEIAGTTYGVDRTPDFSYTKYGALKKVVYPTGGETIFEYEPNMITVPNAEGTSHSLQSSDQIDRLEQGNDVRISEGKSFLITHTQDIILDLQRFQKSENQNQNLKTDIEIYRYDPIYDDSLGAPIRSRKMKFSSSMESYTISLTPGKYFYRITMDEGENAMVATISYVKTIPYMEPGPGIRIRKIISDPMDGPPTTKMYEYTDEDGIPTGISEGYGYKGYGYSTQIDGIGKGYLIYNSSVGMTHSPSLEVFYSEVNEYSLSDSGNIKTKYIFQKLQSPPPSFNFMDAALKIRIDYRLKDGGYQIAKKVENEYLKLPHGGSTFIAITPYMSGYIKDMGSEEFTYNYSSYAVTSQWYFLRRSTEWLYTDGQNPKKKTVEYANDLQTTYLKRQVEYNSDNSVYITKLRYPEDFDVTVFNYSDNNIKKPVLEKQLWHKLSPTSSDSLMISGVVTSYNSKGLPVNYYFFETLNGENSITESRDQLVSDDHYKPRIELQYNSVGSLLSQVKVPGENSAEKEHERFIWGYEGNYLIAHAVNAKQAFHTSFEDESGTAGNSFTGEKAHISSYSKTVHFANGNYLLTYYQRNESGTWQFRQEPVTISNGVHTVHIPITEGITAIDEVRFYPVGASMTTYTYKPLVGVTSVTDPAGRVTRYTYDTHGRLLHVKDHEGNMTNVYEYHYGN